MTTIQYRGYIIEPGPSYTPDSRWQFIHPDYDGAPNEPGEGPADHRFGMEATVEECKAAIDELEGEDDYPEYVTIMGRRIHRDELPEGFFEHWDWMDS